MGGAAPHLKEGIDSPWPFVALRGSLFESQSFESERLLRLPIS